MLGFLPGVKLRASRARHASRGFRPTPAPTGRGKGKGKGKETRGESMGIDRIETAGDQELLDLIDQIYRTGSESHDWAGLLGHTARFVGATSGALGITDHTTGNAESSIFQNGLDEDLLYDRWLGEFNFDTPWARMGYIPKEGEIKSGASLLPVDELRALPLYSGALEPLGIEDCLVASLRTLEDRVTILALYRGRAQGPFGRTERDRFQPLVPHFVRSSHLEALLAKAQVRERAIRGALDEIGFAIFTISEFKPEPLNRQAEALLMKGDGLMQTAGRLRAMDPSSDEAFQASLRAAGGGHSRPPVATATPFPLRRGIGRLPLTCWTVPISPKSETGLAGLGQPGIALLFVGDPEDHAELPSATVARLFDLTAAEARLASAIALGETLREYAERQGVSENTARWTVKRVQSKLGVRRQLDIASILLRAVPGL